MHSEYIFGIHVQLETLAEVFFSGSCRSGHAGSTFNFLTILMRFRACSVSVFRWRRDARTGQLVGKGLRKPRRPATRAWLGDDYS